LQQLKIKLFASCSYAQRSIKIATMYRKAVLSSKAVAVFVLGTILLQFLFLGILKLPNTSASHQLRSEFFEESQEINFEQGDFDHHDHYQAHDPDQSDLNSEDIITGQLAPGLATAHLLPEEPLVDSTSEFPTVHRIERGETLTQIWEKNGASYVAAIRAADAFKRAGLSLSTLQPGGELELRQNESGEIVELRKRISEGRMLLLRANGASEYEHQILEPEIITERRTVIGTIEHSLSLAATKESVPHSLVDEFVDLFGGRVEFSRDLQPGDSFSLIYDERRTDDGFSLPPGAIEAASLLTKGELLVAIRHVGKDGKSRYYDDKGNPLGNFFLRYPLNFTRISSVFTESRFHPVLKTNRPHRGVDFAAPTGTPVRSVADGIVEVAGYHRGNGNWIRIRHSDRWKTLYLHLSRIEAGVQKGARVRRGQQIGRVGATGLATGPHLHFELHDRGRSIDPMKASLPQMPTNGETIPDNVLRVALQTLKEHHQELQVVRKDLEERDSTQSG